jgi:transcriptional regulator with XRE-family HTH domain
MKVNVIKLKAEMKSQGCTVVLLAQKIGLTRAGIYYIFDNEMATLPTLTRIARVLDVDPKSLIT